MCGVALVIGGDARGDRQACAGLWWECACVRKVGLVAMFLLRFVCDVWCLCGRRRTEACEGNGMFVEDVL